MSDLVAVIMSVYQKDDPNHLRLSIDSILKQSYHNFRLLIGVDGLVDTTLKKLLKKYEQYHNIDIYWFVQNRGLTAVLNNLLEEASSLHPSFIARMDSDDISRPNRFEKQIDALTKDTIIDVIGGSIEEINFDGTKSGKVINYPLSHQECFNFFATRNPLAHPAVMFRSSFFNKVPSYNTDFIKNQDTELWYRAFKAGCQFANIPDVVLSFRVSDDMYKRRGGKKFALDVLKLRKRINRELSYGYKAKIFAYCYYIMAISPNWVKRFAYTHLR